MSATVYGPEVREAYAGRIPQRCYDPRRADPIGPKYLDPDFVIKGIRARELRAEYERDLPKTSREPNAWNRKSEIGPGNRRPVFSEGAIYRPGDSDETPVCPASRTVGVRFKLLADAVYTQLIKEQTGETLETEKLQKKRTEKATTLAQSHEIARRLSEQGISVYRSDAWRIGVYGVHSGEFEVMPSFANTCILPTQAAKLRAKYLNALQFFAERNPFLRFWTFTSGKRCRLNKLRRRCQGLSRRISKLNGEAFMQEAGIEIIFRSIEFGSLEFKTPGQYLKESLTGLLSRDEQGNLLLHPHAHCVVQLKNGPLEPEAWRELLRKVWRYWGHNWDEGKRIEDMREVCKYVTKPGEMLKLSSVELAELYRQTKRLKMVQPMGALAADMKQREEKGLWLVKRRTKEGKVWREEPNPNTKEKKHREEADLEAAAKLDAEKGVDTCAVVSRCLPAFNSVGVKEPRVVVMFNRFNREAVERHPLVRRMRTLTREEYLAGMQIQGLMAMQDTGPIRVHTCTPTVRDDADDAPPPDLLEPISTSELFDCAEKY